MIDLRKKSLESYAIPKSKQAAFEYVSLAKLALPPAAAPPAPLDTPAFFVDGYFVSPPIPEIVCLPLDIALQSYGPFLRQRWLQGLKTDPFAALNGAAHGKGAFLYIPPRVKAHLNIQHAITSSDLASPRLFITLGAGAELTLVQTIQAQNPQACVNAATDLSLDAGARVRLIDVQLLPDGARSLSHTRATLKRDARLEILNVNDGSSLSRAAYSVELAEENSSLLLQHLSMLTGDRESHFHALVDHAAPNTTSRTAVKSVLNGTSKASFDGKIYVRPIAQKTMAYQLNNTLLLSDAAISRSKPNLEIFADDVKASHGSTTAQIDEEEMFYLQSRGLSREKARALLTQGFCRELIDAIEIEELTPPLLAAMQRVLHA